LQTKRVAKNQVLVKLTKFSATSIFIFKTKITSVAYNLTTNEMAKYEKYDYLRDANGNKKNIFNKGIIYNIKYYFHLIEPSKLETTGVCEYDDNYV
jgi:hypothetical protein